MSEQVNQERKEHGSGHGSSVSPIRLNRYDRSRFVFVLPMVATGGVALLFSYIYSSLILTFIGLGLTFWGSVLYYITSARYYPDEIFRAVVEAYGKSMSSILSHIGYAVGNAILFYPRQLRLGGLSQGYILVHQGEQSSTADLIQYIASVGDGEDIDKIGTTDAQYLQKKGMIIKAPAQGLIDLFEDRLDANFALMSMEELSMNIGRLFVEEFMMADSVEISADGDDTVRVTIKGRDTARICSSMHSISTALCPVCSSIALALGKSTGKAVMVRESSVGKSRVDTTYSLLEMVG